MAHKIMIDGTTYDVTSGDCNVGGTSYNIQKGMTYVDGTGYDVGFGKPIVVTLVDELESGSTLTSDDLYVLVNDKRIEFDVQGGWGTIEFTCLDTDIITVYSSGLIGHDYDNGNESNWIVGSDYINTAKVYPLEGLIITLFSARAGKGYEIHAYFRYQKYILISQEVDPA